MTEFLAMGGYAPYVWTAYTVTFAALLWNYLDARRRNQRARRDLGQRLRRQGSRPPAA